MTKKNDGGPAFPQLDVNVIGDNMAVQNVHGGAALWDLYAAAALAGYVAWSPDDACQSGPAPTAAFAADYADAMIAERERRFPSKDH